MSLASAGSPMALAEIMRTLEAGGYDFDMLVVSGGAARSALVRQIIADVSGKTVARRRPRSRCLLGSAMLGAVAAGTPTWHRRCRRCRRSRRGEVGAGRRAIAAFHARKRRAFEMLRRTEREIRELDPQVRWPELVIFDCDGVLVDSEVIALGVMRRG